MDEKKVSQYTDLITSQHRQKPKFMATVKAVNEPIVNCFNFLSKLLTQYDVDSTTDPYLETLARWTGTPLVIPGATILEYFGYEDQENSLTFGELDHPEIGGYFRESGQSGSGGMTPKGELLRQLIKAKILKNKSTGNLFETKEILKLVLNHDLFIVRDNKDMTISFKCNTVFNRTHRILVEMFFPLPTGVQLMIES